MHRPWSTILVCLILYHVPHLSAQPRQKLGEMDNKSEGAPAVTMVSSYRIRINYVLKHVVTTEIAAIELWYTRDGKLWTKGPKVANDKQPLFFDAAEDGKYGFRLVVRGHDALAGTAPKPGDLPQYWVEFKVPKPLVPQAIIVGVEAVKDEGPAKRQANAEIPQLIKQLGGANFAERQKAARRLEAIGEPALEPLSKILDTADLETSRRAAVLVRTIQRLVFAPLARFQGHTDKITAVAFSPDEQLAVSSSDDKTVRLWDIAGGKELRVIQGHRSMALSVAFSADGKNVLSCSGWPSEPNADKSIRLWDSATGKELLRLEGHTDTVWKVAFAPDHRHVISAGRDNSLRLWDLETGKQVGRFSGHTQWVRGAAFSPDGAMLVSGSWDNTVRLWDVASGQELKHFEGHQAGVNSVAFSPDGKLIVSGGGQDSDGLDDAVRLWDVQTGKLTRRFDGHKNRVWCVTFSPDGRRILSSSQDGTIRLWDVHTGRELAVYEDNMGEVRGVMFSQDGRRMLSGSEDKMLRIWPLPK